MAKRRLGSRGGPIALLVAGAFACSSSGGSAPRGDAGVHVDAAITTAEAFVDATVGVGPQSPSCPTSSSTTWLSIGDPAAHPVAVPSGGSSPGGPVAVTCTVVSVKGGFDLALTAKVLGSSPTAIVVTTPTGHGAVTDKGATGVTVSLQNAMGEAYGSSACSLAFTYLSHPITSSALAAGRVWAHVSCPAATYSSVSGDGGASPTCDAEADFLFEGCTAS